MARDAREIAVDAALYGFRDLLDFWMLLPLLYLVQLAAVHIAVREVAASPFVLSSTVIIFLVLFVAIARIGTMQSVLTDVLSAGKLVVYIGLIGLLVAAIDAAVLRLSVLPDPGGGPAPAGMGAVGSATVLQGANLALLDAALWLNVALLAAFFLGFYIVVRKNDLRGGAVLSAELLVRRPLGVGAALVGAVVLAYVPTALAALPFHRVVNPMVAVAGVEMPVAVLAALAGSTVGGFLSVRYAAFFAAELTGGDPRRHRDTPDVIVA